MKQYLRKLTTRALVLVSTAGLFTCVWAAQGQTKEYPRFVNVGNETNVPSGWVQFCTTYISECDTKAVEPRDIVLDDKAWDTLVRVNKWVNENIQPKTDMDHYGMIQW